MSTTQIIFSDIKFSLEKTQYLDFTFLENNESIYQAIETILNTKKGNRTKFQNPYFGSILHKLLFEKMTIFTAIQIEEEIFNSLDVWEPRINILKVIVTPDYEANSYSVKINFNIIDINIKDSLILELEVLK